MNRQHKVMLIGVILLFVIVNTALAAIKTFHVEETEFVKVSAEAIDPDNDAIHYYYTPPLDDLGEWQTDYGDAGEYQVDAAVHPGSEEIGW